EGEPLQDLESDVFGKLLSTAGAARGDPESERGVKTAGDSHGRRPRGADGRQEASGAAGGAALPSRLLRVSPRKIGAGCGGHGAGAGLAAGPGGSYRHPKAL